MLRFGVSTVGVFVALAAHINGYVEITEGLMNKTRAQLFQG